ncbi:MBL fold metallo-hydrolase [Maritimibacter sp. HL-12]|jgi:glyoxylase-like metal-dependent hydrolase (beta-lactamase superfamily II)|uniref:MBL fold metallo-hydrolase n=1 Tax=Maritimibacter sp. HL-12 TaxID=1162418 RepID=UPI000A0F05EF|nr:MBL fold metallo-hydrolase [Maritimibacter sp. HL-12]SMH45471.1 Glyoxylase, beta-lactamase superfamily II [Maritimibacter sp. HL-12]
MNITRRTILSSAAAGLASAMLAPRMAWAATEITLGDMRITTLSDGYLTQPADFMFAPMPQDELAAFLAERGMEREAPLLPECNLTLVRHEDRVILFDAGSGPGFMDSVGDLTNALAAVGVDPGDVTHVVFTHGHADHLWGVLDDFDDLVFANARHMMGREEHAFWADPATVDTIGEDRVPMAVGALRRLDALGDAMEVFADGEEILPGIAARASFGHTPGHMSFELRAGNAGVMVVGDAILNDHVAFAHPDWHFGADGDRALAAQSRAGLLDQLAHEQMTMIGFHLPNGGIGRVERQGEGFVFVPA